MEQAMRVSVTEATGELTELVRRAEAEEEVILTRHGQAAVRLMPRRDRGRHVRANGDRAGEPEADACIEAAGR